MEVDIIAKGYEWICPSCGAYNTEVEHTEIVECECGDVFDTRPPLHAFG